MSMRLHWSPRSPFVRKVMIVLHETGLLDQVDCTRIMVAMHVPPDPEILADTPLGKIPALVTEEGQRLFDSRVICEYLDARAGTGLFPVALEPRMQQLRWQALGDGLIDLLLLWRSDLTRPMGPWDAATSGWLTKTRHTMAALEAEADALAKVPFGIGHVAVICALGQLDFRWADADWRGYFPALATWEAEVAKRPSVAANQVIDDKLMGEGEVTLGQLRFD